MSGQPLLDAGKLHRLAVEHAPAYAAATPFPHAVLHDVIDAAVLRSVAAAAQAEVDQGRVEIREHAFSRKGSAGHNRDWSGATRALFHEFNSATFVRFLETLTGIQGLIPDPHYLGGGLHVIPPGGFLGVHADFSRHDALDLDRRINMILYLNDDWDSAWGGDLELWDAEMRGCVATVAPRLGTMIVFSTLSDAYHGHPSPLTCPPDRARLSMATYYYTAGSAQVAARGTHPTLWQSTPGRSRFLTDWTPPALVRAARRWRRR